MSADPTTATLHVRALIELTAQAHAPFLKAKAVTVCQRRKPRAQQREVQAAGMLTVAQREDPVLNVGHPLAGERIRRTGGQHGPCGRKHDHFAIHVVFPLQ